MQWSIFPLGQHLHLTHHLFPQVPHYRLKALHEALMQVPLYRDHAQVVEGYGHPLYGFALRPTVLEASQAKQTASPPDSVLFEDHRIFERFAISDESHFWESVAGWQGATVP
jgi:fatty acid desaturase